MEQKKLFSRGFTIVELLIVIVVIGILAAISMVSYTGVQNRARDAQRLSDMRTITTALERYKIDHGEYPIAVGQTGYYGWEVSHEPKADGKKFLDELIVKGYLDKEIVDPINKSGNYYRYYRYDLYHAGLYACPQNKRFFVLQAINADAKPATSTTSPGFKCTDRDWGPEAWWITGSYE